MDGRADEPDRTGIRTIIIGSGDGRLRATWRVLLAMPVLWILTGDVLAGNVQATVAAIPSGPTLEGGLAQSLLHGGFFAVALAVWARYVDRDTPSNYGVAATGRWGLDLVAGFVAVLAGFGAWYALSSTLGWATVSAIPVRGGGSVVTGAVIGLVALAIHVGIQQVTFFRVIGTAAAEGLHSRGVAPARAVVGALPIAVLAFVSMHTLTPSLRAVDVAIAGAVFGLLYVQTGDLALPVGVHLGVNVSAGTVFVPAGRDPLGPALLRVTEALPSVLPGGYTRAWASLAVAYGLVLAWLVLRGRDVAVVAAIARRPDR